MELFGSSSVNVLNFVSLGYLTSLASNFLGGIYSGSTVGSYTPSFSIHSILTFSSLSCICSGSFCYTRFFSFYMGFLSYLVFFHSSFSTFFLGDVLTSTPDASIGLFSYLLYGCSSVITFFCCNLSRVGATSTLDAADLLVWLP